MSRELNHVCVLFGGPSPEHDVSILTGLQAHRALQEAGRFRRVSAIYWSKTGDFFLLTGSPEASEFADGVPRGSSPLLLVAGADGGFVERKGKISSKFERVDIDSVIVCAHGGPGEDGSLQGALDLAGIRYTGPSVASAALGMDKYAAGEIIRACGLPTLERAILSPDLASLPFDGPYIVKPRFGGSSIGIDVVTDFPTALARLTSNPHLRRGAVIEPYRGDLYDIQVAMCTYPNLTLSAIERPLRLGGSGEILNYEDKYVGGAGMDAAARELPAKISRGQIAQVREIAAHAATALSIRGVARIDFLSNEEELFLNEVNTIPGSLSRHLFIDPAVDFVELLDRMLAESIERPAAQFSSSGATGSLLRDAMSISAKLG